MSKLATEKVVDKHMTPDDTKGQLTARPSADNGDGLIRPAERIKWPDHDLLEVESERSERTKTYHLGGGKWRTIGSPVKAHYREDPDNTDAKWKEINLDFVDHSDRFELTQSDGTSDAPYELTIPKHQIGYTLKGKGGAKVHLTLDRAGDTDFSSEFVQREVYISQVGNVVYWSVPTLDLSFRLMARPESVEVWKVLDGPESPREFEWSVAEKKTDGRYEFLNQEAEGLDDGGNLIELHDECRVVKETDDWRHMEYTEQFTGRSLQVSDPETRSRSWQSAEYPVEIDPSTSKDITANIDDVTVASDGDFNSDQVYGGAITSISTYFYAGLRFRSLGISQGATITKATLQAYVKSTYDGGNTLPMYGDDVDDAPQWSSNDAPYDITKTSNSANWGLTSVSTSETLQITSIVQEIISRSGWSSSNAIRLANGKVTQNGTASFSDYYDTSPDVATLSVTYTNPIPPDTSTSYETFPDVPHIIDRDRRSGQVTSDASNEFRDFRQLNHRPFYAYTLDMSVISPSDQDKIQDLNITHSGYDGSSGNVRFLFKDPDDNSVSDVQFGTGDGSTKKFQLKNKYTFGGQSIKYPQGHIDEGTETIKNDGSTVSDSDIGINYDTGTVEFQNAPADGNALTASFEFFRLCQFRNSEVSVSIETAARRNQTIEIVEVPGA